MVKVISDLSITPLAIINQAVDALQFPTLILKW